MLPLTIREAIEEPFDEERLRLVQQWRDPAGVVCAQGYVGGGARWMRWPGCAVFRFDEEGRVEAAPEPRFDPVRVADLYRRIVHPLILQALGWETLHASSVLMPLGLVGFCGDCESGKSTLAYSLSRRGYRQYSDDSLVLQFGPGGIRALELPFEARLRPEALNFLGAGSSDTTDLGNVPSRPDNGSPSFATEPLSALFVLSRETHGAPRAEQVNAASALTALLPHARCFDAYDGTDRRRVLQHYLDVTAAVPIFRLRFPTGLEHLPELIEQIELSVNRLEAQLV